MSASAFDSQISDELLSAYLDGAVSASERTLVENALRSDPEVAWRLDAMRQTVQLLHSLRQVALPASWSTEAILAATQTAARPNTPPRPALQPEPQASIWQRFLDFWRGGSPMLRNAAVGAFALFLVFSLGSRALFESAQPPAAAGSLVQPLSNETGAAESVAVVADNEKTAPAAADAAPAPTVAEPALAEEPMEEPVAELAAQAFDLQEETAPKNPSQEDAPASVQGEAGGAVEAEAMSAASNDAETQRGAAALTAPQEQARGVFQAPAAPSGGGGEDVTELDAAVVESAAVEAAAQPMAALAQADKAMMLPTPTLVAATVLSMPITIVAPTLTLAPTVAPTATPTVAPTATPRPTATATPAAAALARPADAENARMAPPASAPPTTGQPVSSPAWMRLMQWAAALAGVSFLALWLRSRRSPS